MNKFRASTTLLLAVLLLGSGVFYSAVADHDDNGNKHRHERRERKHSEHNGERDLATVNNPTYTENCGDCHLAYQPGLMPSGSWDKILKGLPDHFGEAVELDSESMKTIAEYLKIYAADNSSTKLSRKIMRSMGNQIPLRITQIPYIQRKHHEIDAKIFTRESIGSFSNCTACHKTAGKGVYDDDLVTIPK